ncbi:MAG: AAA family ATPase [Thiomargarita sp.]|nr:AAA family ATPase [Thiomargarita sp.]
MTSLKIGISGSHRTGKTTLAEAISKKIRTLTNLKTSSSAVFKKYGLHPAQTLDFKTRLWIQHQILAAGIEMWQTPQFVTDRTPIDFMAYTLADIQGATDVNFTALESYLTQCFEVTNDFFSHIIILQPAIPLVYEAGKAALNRSYMAHLNTLIQGLCHDERLTCPSFLIKRHLMNLEERVKFVHLTANHS